MTSCPTNFIIRWCGCAAIVVLFSVLAVIFTFSAALNALDKNTFNAFFLCYRYFPFSKKIQQNHFLVSLTLQQNSFRNFSTNDFYSSCIFCVFARSLNHFHILIYIFFVFSLSFMQSKNLNAQLNILSRSMEMHDHKCD